MINSPNTSTHPPNGPVSRTNLYCFLSLFWKNFKMSHQAETVLQRIKEVLLQIRRLIEMNNFERASGLITSCDINLNRIEGDIVRRSVFLTIKSSLHQLHEICMTNNNSANNQTSGYSAPRRNLGGKGRPSVEISPEQLHLFHQENFTAPQVARLLKCSTSVVYKRSYEIGLKFRGKYSTLSNEELNEKVKEIKKMYPRSGNEMISAYLRSYGHVVQRRKVRQTVQEVDPVGVAVRWGNTVQRRTYSVPTPNSLWHMDAHLKLSRWGFVTHGCVDGYSRMITYVQCATSITAETVLKLFIPAIKKFGIPSRVRSDHGYENIFVAVLMNCLRGLDHRSHIAGKSTHNQRIERLWRDVHFQVTFSFYELFLSLEDQGHLDVENKLHLFALQYIYKDVISQALNTFQRAWNMHRIRTAKNQTPRQLWLRGMLESFGSNHTAVAEIFNSDVDTLGAAVRRYFPVDMNAIDAQNNEDVSAFTVSLQLTQNQILELENLKSRGRNHVTQYLACVAFLEGEYTINV